MMGRYLLLGLIMIAAYLPPAYGFERMQQRSFCGEIADSEIRQRCEAKVGTSSDYSITACGDLLQVDLGAAVDGPLFYIERGDGHVVSRCGGVCMHPSEEAQQNCRTMCPPKEWDCK